jgi:hypothetical protein
MPGEPPQQFLSREAARAGNAGPHGFACRGARRRAGRFSE